MIHYIITIIGLIYFVVLTRLTQAGLVFSLLALVANIIFVTALFCLGLLIDIPVAMSAGVEEIIKVITLVTISRYAISKGLMSSILFGVAEILVVRNIVFWYVNAKYPELVQREYISVILLYTSPMIFHTLTVLLYLKYSDRIGLILILLVNFALHYVFNISRESFSPAIALAGIWSYAPVLEFVLLITFVGLLFQSYVRHTMREGPMHFNWLPRFF